MRRPRRPHRRVLALALLATALGGGVAAGELIEFGNFNLSVGGGFHPKRLPAKRAAPLGLNMRMSFGTDDGTTPPPLDEIVLDFDRDGRMFTRGLARCSAEQLENQTTETARKRCRKALVGKGTAEAIVDFPDQDPFTARGPILAFNGEPQEGHKVVLLHTFANVPAPTAFVVPAVVSKAPGRAFRHRVTTEIPTIAGGNGSLVRFKLEIERRWRHKGKRRSYLLARCRKGYFLVKGEFRWLDGMRVKGSIVRTCKRRRQRR